MITVCSKIISVPMLFLKDSVRVFEDSRGNYKVLMGKPEGKRPL